MSKYQTTNGYWVYGHRTPDGKYYIGMSKQQPKDRWQPSMYKRSSLGPFIEQYGWSNIEHYIFIDGLSKKQAELLEDELIMKFRTEGLCINQRRSGGRERDNSDEYRQEQREYKKQYYQTNRERVNKQTKQYYENNREQILEQQKQYYAANAEARREKMKQYRQTHAERIREYKKQYQQTNTEKISEWMKQYRQTNAEAIREKKKQYYEDNKEHIREWQKQYHKQYDKQVRSTPEGKIYHRVDSFNRYHPDRAIETPLEAKTKYLEYGYVPVYVKHSDLQPDQLIGQLEIEFD